MISGLLVRIRRSVAFVALSLIAGIAHGAPGPVVSSPAVSTLPATPVQLEAVFDRAFGPQGGLSYNGAVVAVVQDGKVLLVKGYGYEDAARTRPIDPEKSRFIVASITKTFIATRVAQLIQTGVIRSVDDPANRYFKSLRLPDNHGHVITIRDLLTHQAGFADADLPFVLARKNEPEPTVSDFRRAMPPFVRRAETGSVYSNYSLALMGLMIRDLTGQTVGAALRDHVLAPLGMTSTGFPDADQLAALPHAQAFYPDGSTSDIPNDIQDNPIIRQGAGGLASTGSDMARYMIGELGGSPILSIPPTVSESTRRLMFSRLAGASPLVQGYGTVFMLNDWNGVPLVEHGGRSLGRISYMTLVPSQRLGVFVSVTAENGAPAAADLWGGLTGHPGRMKPNREAPVKLPGLFSLRATYLVPLFGALRPPSVAGLPPPESDVAQYVGDYRSARHVARGATFLLDVLIKGEVSKVTLNNGSLAIDGRTGYHALARDVFWRDPGTERGPGYNNLVVFRRGADGHVRDMVFGYTDTVYDRLTPITAPATAIKVFLIAAAVFLTAFLAPLWGRAALGKAAWGRWVMLVTPVLLIALPFLFFGFWPSGAPTPFNSTLITPIDMAPFEIAGTLAALCALSASIFAVMAWRCPCKTGRTWWARLHLTVLGVAGVGLAWALFQIHAVWWP